MTIDGYLGMSLALIAFAIANLSACIILKSPWTTGHTDEKYLQRTTAPLFIYLVAATGVTVLVFLVSLLMPHLLSQTGDPVTLGLSKTNAMILFYAAGISAAFIALPTQISLARKALSPESPIMGPVYWILFAFLTSGSIYALLVVLLAGITPLYHYSTGFTVVGTFMIVGAFLSLLSNALLRPWFKSQLNEMHQNPDMIFPMESLTIRMGVSVAAFAIPAFAGLFYAAL